MHTYDEFGIISKFFYFLGQYYIGDTLGIYHKSIKTHKKENYN